jgi:hypothetical protein
MKHIENNQIRLFLESISGERFFKSFYFKILKQTVLNGTVDISPFISALKRSKIFKKFIYYNYIYLSKDGE